MKKRDNAFDVETITYYVHILISLYGHLAVNQHRKFGWFRPIVGLLTINERHWTKDKHRNYILLAIYILKELLKRIIVPSNNVHRKKLHTSTTDKRLSEASRKILRI